MSIQELEAEIKALKEKVSHLEDIEEIKRLQYIYAYYLEHWMSQEIVDLYSDRPDVSVEMSTSGLFVGKEGVARYFAKTKPTPEFLHQVLQVQGVIDIDPNGNEATGRWYGWGLMALPKDDGIWQGYNNGLYECEYVKEGGKWKFKKIHWNRIFLASYREGWVEPGREAKGDAPLAYINTAKPDLPTTTHKPYPSGYIVPFHYKHPITGK